MRWKITFLNAKKILFRMKNHGDTKSGGIVQKSF